MTLEEQIKALPAIKDEAGAWQVKQRDYEDMLAFRNEYDDEPDGAFFQLAQDIHGWGPEDWAWFTQEFEKRAGEAGKGEIGCHRIRIE